MPWSLAPGGVSAAGPQQAAERAMNARVIVKYRDAAARGGSAKVAPLASRLDGLAQRRGLALKAHRALDERTQVVLAAGLSSAELARRLSADADIDYAVPDRRMRVAVVPSDSLFDSAGAAGPDVGQWYLKPPVGEVLSAIDAVSAWDVTRGSSNIVVAVLDTGVRFDHPDLLGAAAGGKLLPGYDFVRTSIGNDGDGADADASDPGDFVSQADLDAGVVSASDCEVSDSSWHGTQVAGIVAAITNNGAGMAGTSWNARVLPLRVLGKCGGFQSDVIAGMRWAAGLGVANAPPNPTPARVLNLSLGGPGSCDAAYQGAIDEVLASGAVIVASAGNSVGHRVGSPANCNGVIGVGGLRHIGTKVGFSDLGTGVAISAPGGNCVNLVGPCLYPILTTSNSGRQGPEAASYTDGRNITVGTSFSAPLVAGTAALMLSVHPRATPAQVAALLQGSAAAFPTTGAEPGVPQCTAPQFDTANEPIDQAECYCTATTCGAGMLNARAAVAAARVQALAATGVQALITVTPANPVAGQAFTLDAAGSLLGGGNTLAGSVWSLLDGGGIVASLSAATPQVSVTPSAGGTVRVQLEVTDSAGNRSTQALSVFVSGAPPVVPDPPAASGGGGGAVGWGYLLALLAAVLAVRRVRG